MTEQVWSSGSHSIVIDSFWRNVESLLTYMENLAEDARISQVFTAEIERQRRTGNPSLSLEINGSPPVPHRDNKGLAKRMNVSLQLGTEKHQLFCHTI
ncbi:ankyrin and armadillo repeat-containing protein [Carassius gibelio]|uniref:ankyrin and armadillo repeat-containing protein n=1 Tax=Carassius gibelio TaxID=101364 RepID=UPI0022794C46|nr:ankyrin and armadillo repeat-containing protein [Carassius gibelio]